jgi:hypothetical protein
VERLRTLSEPLLALDPAAARNPAVNDPDRIEEVEALLNAARISAASSEAAPAGPTVDRWFYTNVEKVAWQWVGLDDRMMEELG